MKRFTLAIAAFAFTLSTQAQDKAAPAVISAKGAPAVSSSKAAPVTTVAGNTSTAEFKFEIEEYNFGTIKQGESVSYEFNFSNVGKDPLIISEAHGSCGCTVPVWPKEPIKKGDKGSIKITFNSTGKQGMQDKTVSISSNATGGTKVLHIKGNVEAAPAAATPSSVPVQATPVPADKK